LTLRQQSRQKEEKSELGRTKCQPPSTQKEWFKLPSLARKTFCPIYKPLIIKKIQMKKNVALCFVKSPEKHKFTQAIENKGDTMAKKRCGRRIPK